MNIEAIATFFATLGVIVFGSLIVKRESKP